MHRNDVGDLSNFPSSIGTKDHPLHSFRLIYIPYSMTIISNNHAKKKAKEDICSFLGEESTAIFNKTEQKVIQAVTLTCTKIILLVWFFKRYKSLPF